MYRYLLDGNLVDEALGWDELVVTHKRDRSISGILKTYDVTLTFGGSGYDYIKSVIDTTGYCNQIEVIIQRVDGVNYITDYEGVIFLSDTEFKEFSKECKVKLTDRSFNAKVYENLDIPFVLSTSVSKDVDNTMTTGIMSPVEVICFEPGVGCAGSGNKIWMYSLYDALDFGLRWLTDESMQFESSYFGAGGTFPNIYITCGYAIRMYSIGASQADFETNLIPINYRTLLDGCNKMFNTHFSVIESTALPKLKLEHETFWYESGTSIELNNIDEIVTRTSVDRLYNRVKLGSAEELNYSSLEFPETIRMVGFKKEEYYVVGNCNINAVKDLESPFVTSSNVIEYLIENPSDTGFDDKWFMIQCEDVGGGSPQASSGQWIGASTSCFYNELLTNKHVLTRHSGSIPNSIALSLGVVDNRFKAISSTETSYNAINVVYDPTLFDIEINDVGSNYDAALYKYTAPQSGAYSFRVYIPVKFISTYAGQSQCSGDVEVYFDVYDAGNTLLYSMTQFSGTINARSGAIHTLDFTDTINLNISEYVKVRVITEGYSNGSLRIDTYLRLEAGCVFECTSTSDGGGIYKSYDPEMYPVYVHEFKYPLINDSYKKIEQMPNGLIRFSVNGEDYKSGWIDELKYNKKDQVASFKLISTKVINQ